MVLYVMGLKKIELVLENCETIIFNPCDISIDGEMTRISHMFELGKSVGLRNILICIKKNAKPDVKNLWGDKEWIKRLKIPDITAIYFDKERFYVDDWDFANEFDNPNQHFFERENYIRIIISKDKKFIKNYTPRETRR